MERHKLGGIAMIAGAIMSLVTMIFHPTGHDVAAGQGTLALVVHALALTAQPIVFFGGWALTCRLSQRGALAELALVFYGVSAVAALMAATASGLLAPGLIEQTMSHAGDAQRIMGAVLHYNGDLNQAFAKVLVAASSVAIGLWSIEIIRTRLIRLSSGVVGCVVAVGTLAVLLSGNLRLDVHGFGAVVLAQTVWLIMVGAELNGVDTERAQQAT